MDVDLTLTFSVVVCQRDTKDPICVVAKFWLLVHATEFARKASIETWNLSIVTVYDGHKPMKVHSYFQGEIAP